MANYTPEQIAAYRPEELARSVSIDRADGTREYLFIPTDLQAEIMAATEPNVFIYGSRGGGKSLCMRWLCHALANAIPNFRYAILRTSFPELLKNHLIYVEEEMAAFGGEPAGFTYHKTDHIAYYPNGSRGFFAQCYDADTEVLTETRGFVRFPELLPGEAIASRDMTTGEMRFDVPVAYQQRESDGRAIHYQTSGVDLLVSPDHPMLCVDAQGRHVPFTAEEGLSRPLGRRPLRFVRQASWVGREQAAKTLPLPTSCGVGRPPRVVTTVPMDEWLEFLGWFLAEGSTSQSLGPVGMRHVVSISQKKYPEDFDRLVAMLRRWGFTVHVTNHTQSPGTRVLTVTQKQLYEALAIFGKCDAKFVPEEVKRLSPRQIEIFLEALFKGDGVHRGDAWGGYVTTSRRLADDVQELLLRVGRVGTVLPIKPSRGRKPAWCVSLTHTRVNPVFTPKRGRRVTYHGTFYDVTMPHSPTLLVRRNGRIVWGHNCATDADVKKILGAEVAMVVFDEAPTFKWEHMRLIAASVRVAKNAGIRPMVRYMGNPVGESIEELWRYFIDKDITPEEDSEYRPEDWRAIEIGLQDNPHLDVEQYRRQFAGLPEHYRKAWLEGVRVEERTLFRFRPTLNGQPYHVVDEMPMALAADGPVVAEVAPGRWKAAPGVRIYRAFDWGFFPDPAVVLWFAVYGRRIVCFKERVYYRTLAEDVAKDVVRESNGLSVVATYADPTVDRATGADVVSIRDVMEDHGVPLELSVNDRERFAFAIHNALQKEIEPGVPRVQFLRTGCPYLIKYLPRMKWKEEQPNAMAEHRHDHPVVTFAYFVMSVIPEVVTPLPTTVRRWMRPKTRAARPRALR